MEIRRTYKYRMYRTGRRNRHLHNQIDIAGIIWNHSLALQKRYYRLCGGYISEKRLKKHIAKLRREVPRAGNCQNRLIELFQRPGGQDPGFRGYL